MTASLTLLANLLAQVAVCVTWDWNRPGVDQPHVPATPEAMLALMVRFAGETYIHPEYTPGQPRLFGAWSF